MVALLMMVVVVWKVVQKVVRNLFFEGFRTIVWYFWVSYVPRRGFLRSFLSDCMVQSVEPVLNGAEGQGSKPRLSL